MAARATAGDTATCGTKKSLAQNTNANLLRIPVARYWRRPEAKPVQKPMIATELAWERFVDSTLDGALASVAGTGVT